MSIVDKKVIIDSLKGKRKNDWGLRTIKAPRAWSKTKGEGVKIAIIDTGVDVNHPDLKHAIKASIDLRNQTTNVIDEYGHGTHVAGLIAGVKTGVAPEAELYIAKVLDENGKGNMTNILNGITFAINYEVDILCISLGMQNSLPQILEERIKKAYNAGITIVCATGNLNNRVADYPAFYDEVIGVGGIGRDSNRANFSNYGEGLDVVAPAIDILSTYKDGKYAKLTGTSMASPLVAGGIALIISHYRKQGIELSPKDIKEMLSKLGDRKTEEYGYGIFDLTKLID